MLLNHIALNHLCRVDSSTAMVWTGPFPVKGCLVSNYYYYYVLQKFSVRNANSVDLDQTPRCAASDLGLHCVPMSLL